MALPIDVAVENLSKNVASTGQVPIDFAVQWTDPPPIDWAIRDRLSGSETASVLEFWDPCVLDLGAGGSYAAYLGSMATQTTRRVHVVGVPMTAAQRLTGQLESGDLSPTVFSLAGDGLALFGGTYPTVDFGSTNVATTRQSTRDFNPLREVVELDGRNSTYGVYHQWRCSLYPGKKRVKWTLTLSFTDERLSDRVLAWPRVRIKVPSTWELHVEHATRCPGAQVYSANGFKYWDIVAAHTIHDGQSARFQGTFMLPLPTATELGEWEAMPGNRINVPRAICDPEEFRGKLYFYGGLPVRPNSRNEASCRDRYDVFENFMRVRLVGRADYARSVGANEHNANTSSSGEQPDFAAGPFYETFFRDGGNPLRLAEHDAAGLRHMSRPITHRRRGLDEASTFNARIVKWGDYEARDYYTYFEYFHTRDLKSRFPTTDPRGKSTTGLNQWVRVFAGMIGMQRSHFSILHAIEAMFLDGCFDAEDIVRQSIEWMLHEWPTHDVGYAGVGQMRNARMVDMACWAWFLTGDTRIVEWLQRIEDNWQRIFFRYNDHVSKGHTFQSFGENDYNKTKTLGVIDGVDYGTRTIRGKTNDPWQVRLAIGFYRAYQVTSRTFWQTLIKDITKTWLAMWRYQRVRFASRGVWSWRGPLWVEAYQVIYPGLASNPGTYGELPPEEWFAKEENEYVLWEPFEGGTWAPAMMAVAMQLHASDRTVYDKALSVWSQEYDALQAKTNVTIFDKAGEWFGDDALVPDNSGLVLDFVTPRVLESEPGFQADISTDYDILDDVLEPCFEFEPAFTLTLGDFDWTDAEIEPCIDFESDFAIEVDSSIEITAESARVFDFEANVAAGEELFEIDVYYDMSFAEETIEDVEPAFVAYGDAAEYVFAPETTTVTEVDAVFDDGTQVQSVQTIEAKSGPPPKIVSTSGAQRIEAVSG